MIESNNETEVVANANTGKQPPDLDNLTSTYHPRGYYTLLFNLSSSMVKMNEIVGRLYLDKYGISSYTKSKDAIACFTYNMITAVKRGFTEISFSSDSNRYKEIIVNGNKISTGVGYDATIKLVLLFEELGMLTREIGYKINCEMGFGNKSKSGYITLTQKMIEMVEMNVDLEKVKVGVRNDVLLLKDKKSNPLEFPSTNYTKEIIKVLTRYNKFMSKQDVRLDGEVLDTGLARIFNIDFNNGGRLYTSGNSYQGVFAHSRKRITINGNKTAEVDIKGSHISILHTMCNSLMLDGYDPYDIPMDGVAEYDRDKMAFMLCFVNEKHNPFRNLVKVALLIMVNADSQHKASYSLRDKINQQLKYSTLELESQSDDFLSTLTFYGLKNIDIGKLFKVIKKKHDAIKEHFFSGAGVWLQKLEGDIFTKVIEMCLEKEYPVLIIHDSCRAEIQHIQEIGDFIKLAWMDTVGDILNLKLEYEF